MVLPVRLRNGLAELILDAFDDAAARAALRTLAQAAAGGDAIAPEGADRLEALGLVHAAAPGRLRLRDAHREHRAALADHARRGTRATEAAGAGPGKPLPRLLARAAALADAGLYFEVHELLEPAWLRAAEPLRTALQGLIQVAVALHHLEHGNREGARSLLDEGRRKLAATAGALPLDAGGWLAAVAAAAAALGRGDEPGPLPPWPGPREPARPAAAARPAGGAGAPTGREEQGWRCS
jgi:hypothetical protein